MELKLKEYQLPAEIAFNFEEIKAELEEKCTTYEAMVYTENQVKEAKNDRASLNKFKKSLNDERIRMEKEYLTPFNTFKSQINELLAIIDKPVSIIDNQVKAFEDKKKTEKFEEIQEYYLNDVVKPVGFEELKLKQIWDDKWLNASVSLAKAYDSIQETIKGIQSDLETIDKLPEFSFEAKEVYKESLDLNRAIAEASRMSQIAKAKAEAEAIKAKIEGQKASEAEQAKAVDIPQSKEEKADTEVKRSWMSFKALLSKEEALELNYFFKNKGIKFGPA